MNIAQDEIRSTDEIAMEIKGTLALSAEAHVDVGRLLIEAKDQLKDDKEKWLDWLSNHVDMSVSTAQRLMRVARCFPKMAPVPHMEYSKLLLLTRIPKQSLQDFLDATHNVNGVEKSVEAMSRVELDDAVKAYKAKLGQEPTSSTKKKSPLGKCLGSLKKDVEALSELIESIDPTDDQVKELRTLCAEILRQTDSASDDQPATNN